MEKVVVGVDVGFGHTKAYTKLNGKEYFVKFPSWVAVAHRGSFSEVKSYPFQGKELWIGEPARHSPNRIEITTPEDIIAYYPVFKMATLDALGLTDRNRDVVVITGLPPKFYFEVAKPQSKLTLMEEEGNVIWQGLGVLIDVMKDMDVYEGDTVVVIDVGFNTVDYLIAVYTRGVWKKITVNSMTDMGLMKAVDLFRQELPNEFGIVKSWAKQRLISAFEKGVISIDGENINVDNIKQKSIETYSDMIVSRLKNELGEEIIINDRLVLAGGGANLIKDRIRQERKNFVIPDRPEFSNARGYYEYGYGILTAK